MPPGELIQGDWHTKEDEEDDAPEVVEPLEEVPDDVEECDDVDDDTTDDMDELIDEFDPDVADDEADEFTEDSEELSAPTTVASELDLACLSLELQAASSRLAIPSAVNMRIFINVVHPQNRDSRQLMYRRFLDIANCLVRTTGKKAIKTLRY